ncbi:hypothetical protein [Sporosarcina sp. FSL K6-5500]|uniref:hypothetical protein n=1 Tax=Sporosarcina sp. FSL K6-5500 TaxID=2921558 RepID=UPI0030F98036
MVNDTEKRVAAMAIKQYRDRQNEYREIRELLSTKKFKYGDYVVKKGTSYFDGVFGTGEGSIGKIVWFDEEWNYYRVRYGEDSPFIGAREDDIELYDGEIPQHLIDYDIEDSTYIRFKI